MIIVHFKIILCLKPLITIKITVYISWYLLFLAKMMISTKKLVFVGCHRGVEYSTGPQNIFLDQKYAEVIPKKISRRLVENFWKYLRGSTPLINRRFMREGGPPLKVPIRQIHCGMKLEKLIAYTFIKFLERCHGNFDFLNCNMSPLLQLSAANFWHGSNGKGGLKNYLRKILWGSGGEATGKIGIWG